MKAGIVFPNLSDATTSLSPKARLEEALGLANAIDLEVIHSEIVNLKEIKPATYFGKGYLAKLKTILEEQDAGLVIIDAGLTPIQQRNLEKELGLKVIDRTALILEIFGERAKTKEGKLQVELAHLTYQRSRLVRSWTHLERQRGGAGFLGGPGETQIELDRRIIDDKIIRIKKELEKVKNTRELQRNSRKKVPYPVVALVGYTNAGKSSIFNHITKAEVFAKDLLFATLDPTMRRIRLKSGREIILSDTVGFISDLPHELVMSFRATLEEVLSADAVVHVRDISNADTSAQRKDVLSVLHNLGLKDIEHEDNYLELFNKIDLLEKGEKTKLKNQSKKEKGICLTSAATGEGCDEFLLEVDKVLSINHKDFEASVDASDGKLISWIHAHAKVVSTKLKNKTLFFKIKIDDANLGKLQAKLKQK